MGLAGSVFPSGCHRHPAKPALHKVISVFSLSSKLFYNRKKSFFLPSSQLNDMVVSDAKAETVDVAFSLTLVAKTGEQLVRGGDFQGRR